MLVPITDVSEITEDCRLVLFKEIKMFSTYWELSSIDAIVEVDKTHYHYIVNSRNPEQEGKQFSFPLKKLNKQFRIFKLVSDKSSKEILEEYNSKKMNYFFSQYLEGVSLSMDIPEEKLNTLFQDLISSINGTIKFFKFYNRHEVALHKLYFEEMKYSEELEKDINELLELHL